MATLQENATAVKAAQEAIDAAIRAKGATTAGGLNNAAAAIAAIPSGGWTEKPWRNDGKTHLWFSYTDTSLKCFAKLNAQFVSAAPFTVDWGDGQIDTVAASASFTQRNLTHYYQDRGDYEVVISGYDQMKLTSSWFGASYEADISRYCVRQCEFANATCTGGSNAYRLYSVKADSFDKIPANMLMGGSILTKSVLFSNLVTEIGDSAFDSCVNLENIGSLENVTSIGSYAFKGCSNLNLGILSLPACTRLESQCFSYGPTFTSVSCPNLEHLGYQCFSNSALTQVGDMPRLTTCAGWYNMSGNHIRTVGSLESVTSFHFASFEEIGQALTADAEGIKTTINANQPMDTWVRIPNTFPWCAPTTTKFVCTDGNIVYKNHSGTSRWTLNYSSYSAFPAAGISTYWYRDAATDKWYTWNGSSYTEVA